MPTPQKKPESHGADDKNSTLQGVVKNLKILRDNGFGYPTGESFENISDTFKAFGTKDIKGQADAEENAIDTNNKVLIEEEQQQSLPTRQEFIREVVVDNIILNSVPNEMASASFHDAMTSLITGDITADEFIEAAKKKYP